MVIVQEWVDVMAYSELDKLGLSNIHSLKGNAQGNKDSLSHII